MLDAKNVLSVIPDDGSVNKAEVRPWLQDFTATWVRHHITYGPKEIRDQINATYDAGYLLAFTRTFSLTGMWH